MERILGDRPNVRPPALYDSGADPQETAPAVENLRSAMVLPVGGGGRRVEVEENEEDEGEEEENEECEREEHREEEEINWSPEGGIDIEEWREERREGEDFEVRERQEEGSGMRGGLGAERRERRESQEEDHMRERRRCVSI